MSDIARRLAEEKYPHYAAPSWEDGATKDDVMPSVDASWQDAEADMQRASFLAGWDAAIEHAAQAAETLAATFRHGNEDGEYATYPEEWSTREVRDAVGVVATTIRAERSNR